MKSGRYEFCDFDVVALIGRRGKRDISVSRRNYIWVHWCAVSFADVAEVADLILWPVGKCAPFFHIHDFNMRKGSETLPL